MSMEKIIRCKECGTELGQTRMIDVVLSLLRMHECPSVDAHEGVASAWISDKYRDVDERTEIVTSLDLGAHKVACDSRSNPDLTEDGGDSQAVQSLERNTSKLRKVPLSKEEMNRRQAEANLTRNYRGAREPVNAHKNDASRRRSDGGPG